jgi:hypothetical protein
MVKFLKFLRYSVRTDNTFWIDFWRRRAPFAHWLNTGLYHLGKRQCARVAANSRDALYVFSVSRNPQEAGNYRYNGGVKLLCNWIHVLDLKGIEACLMTHDGSFENWMDYKPTVKSYDAIRTEKQNGRTIVGITSWLVCDEFKQLVDRYYFYDCELAYTAGSYYGALASGSHYGLLKRELKGRIQRVATHSRTQQAWYMTKFGFRPDLIPIWIDSEAKISLDDKPKNPIHIGYMTENAQVSSWVAKCEQAFQLAEIPVEFVQIKGDEATCSNLLSTCSIFLGFNVGKSPVFGEGSPLPQLEAMTQGAAVVAFDVNGNREYLIDHYNGFVVPTGDIEALVEKAIFLCSRPEVLHRFQRHALSIAETFADSTLKWERLSRFLEINNE